MADDTKLPPLDNWASQTFAYGWLLDHSSASDYTNQIRHDHSIANPNPDNIHLLNLNPNSISVDEPIATSIEHSMGGGKVIESRGGIFKTVSIRGTTGFIPPIAPHATHMRVAPNSLVADLADIGESVISTQATGFFEFYRLRRLFRKFMHERRKGKVVAMHWLDFKADEFWLVEPKRFGMQRSRFGFNYDIQFDLIEPSQVSLSRNVTRTMGTDVPLSGTFSGTQARGKQALDKLLRNPLKSSIDTPTWRTLERLANKASAARAFIQRHSLETVTLFVQRVLNQISAIQTFFAELASLRRLVADTPLMLYRQLYSAVVGLGDAIMEMTDENVYKREWNEWQIEAQMLSAGLIAHYQATFGEIPGRAMAEENEKFSERRAVQGTRNQFMTEPANSPGSPLVDPFVGATGLSLVGDIDQMTSVTALRPESVLTGETIFDVAHRTLGDAGRFIDLIVFNRLSEPYIVADKTNKPPGTIAWGEQIFIPTADDPESQSSAPPIAQQVAAFTAFVDSATENTLTFDTTNDPWLADVWKGFTVEFLDGDLEGQERIVVANDSNTFTLNRPTATPADPNTNIAVKLKLFSLNRKATPETIAFGRGIAGVFTKVNGLITDGTVDVMISPDNDLATVVGLANLEQVVALLLQTPRGSDKAFPWYGVTSIVGRRFEPNMAALYVFYVRSALLNDPRIEAVEQPTVKFENGALFFSCYVKPIRVQQTLYFRVPLI